MIQSDTLPFARDMRHMVGRAGSEMVVDLPADWKIPSVTDRDMFEEFMGHAAISKIPDEGKKELLR